MTRRTFFRLAAIGAAPVLVCTQAQAHDPQTIQIGLAQGLFKDTQPAVVQALAKPLRDLVKRSTGLTGDVELIADPLELAAKMKAGKLQLGVFHGYEFAWVKQADDEIVPVVVSVPPARKFQACVLVRSDSPHKELEDLKDEGVIVPRATKGHCTLYFDTLRARLPATTAKPMTKPAMTSEEALDAIVNGDQTAALVDASALLGYQTLQPGAAKQLRCLCESEVFPPTVLAYRKGGLNEGTVASLRKLLTESHQTAAGKPLLMLWNLKGFELAPADYGEQLTRSLKNYPSPKSDTGTIRTAGRAGDK